MAEGTIGSARRRQDAVLSRLTQIEKDIVKLETRTVLVPNEQCRIKCLIEQIKEDNKEFKQCHLEVLNFVSEDDQTTLDAEELVYDEHGGHIVDIFTRLEQLFIGEDSMSFPTVATAADLSHSLSKRL